MFKEGVDAAESARALFNSTVSSAAALSQQSFADYLEKKKFFVPNGPSKLAQRFDDYVTMLRQNRAQK
jgi:hypothetical protein